MVEYLDLMYEQRSIRAYTAEPVAAEQIETILRAAMAAPSARNLLPWHFVIVRERELLDELASIHKYARMLEQAAVAVVVCGDQDISPQHWVEDTCAATQNLLLAATAIGLGGTWISIYPKKKHQKRVRDLLDIPEQIGVLCVVALGHPAEKKEPRTQYDETRLHQDRWQR